MVSTSFCKLALAAALIAAAALGPTPAKAEGLIATPWGWRAAPCCREQGFPGYQGRPPNEFLTGVLAPIFWGEIVPRLLERLPPPPAYAYAPPRPPAYRPPPPEMTSPAPPAPPPPAAAPAPDREQWKQQLLSEGRKFCEQYPDDPVCGERK